MQLCSANFPQEHAGDERLCRHIAAGLPAVALRRLSDLTKRLLRLSWCGKKADYFMPQAWVRAPAEAAHCQNGSRRCVHKNGVICKIMRVLQPWTHMDTDFPMTLYENQFICSYGNLCPPASSVSKSYPVFTVKSGLSSAPFHPRTPPRFSGEYPLRTNSSPN